MTTNRTLTVVAAFALALAGCGSKNCNDATPPVKQVPTACTAVVGQNLSVPVDTCPKCDQAAPTCDVRIVTGAGATAFTLEPLSQVCDPTSCPFPASSCPIAPVGCVITAQMLAGLDPTGSYQLNIVTDSGQVVTRNLTFGSTSECTGMTALF